MNPPLEPLPGADWVDVEECSEYTAEQAARKFLSLEWEHQVRVAARFLEAASQATACWVTHQ